MTHQKDKIKQEKKIHTFPETSESLDETTEDNTEISKTSEIQHKRTEEKRHIPETSESLDETKEDNTDISKTCHKQGSTTEDNRKILHKEDRKERIQGEDPSHRQGSTTKDYTKISHREDGKKQHKCRTRKVLQPKTTELQ